MLTLTVNEMQAKRLRELLKLVISMFMTPHWQQLEGLIVMDHILHIFIRWVVASYDKFTNVSL